MTLCFKVKIQFQTAKGIVSSYQLQTNLFN